MAVEIKKTVAGGVQTQPPRDPHARPRRLQLEIQPIPRQQGAGLRRAGAGVDHHRFPARVIAGRFPPSRFDTRRVAEGFQPQARSFRLLIEAGQPETADAFVVANDDGDGVAAGPQLARRFGLRGFQIRDQPAGVPRAGGVEFRSFKVVSNSWTRGSAAN